MLNCSFAYLRAYFSFKKIITLVVVTIDADMTNLLKAVLILSKNSYFYIELR